MRLAALAIALAWGGAATTITGPIAGYVAESPGVLRPILGVPGSYRFGDSIALPAGMAQIRVAPGQDYALAESADAGMAVIRLAAGNVTGVAPVAGALSSADWVVFSPGAAAAVLVSASAGRLQVIAGLPDAPKVASEIDTASLPDIPRTAALSDDGRVLLIASRQHLYLMAPGGDPQLLMSCREIAALVLFRNGVDAALWDTAGTIHLWHNLASAPADRVLVSGMKGTGKLYPSWDGTALFAILAGSRAIFSIDVASGEVLEVETTEAPSMLAPLRNRDTFLISAKPRQPAWIFYQDGTAPRVVFVVPPAEALP